MTTEVVNDPAPFEEDRVLSTQWLSGALKANVKNIRVVERIDPNKATAKIRFQVQLGESKATLPESLCVKAFFSPARRSLAMLGRTEAGFYATLAPRLSVRVPKCVYAATNHETGHGLIIMEDLINRGAHFLSALSAYSVDQTAASLEQLAALHAARWSEPSLQECSFLALDPKSITSHIGVEQLQVHLNDSRAEGLPSTLKDANRVLAAALAILRIAKTAPQCLVHGDAHAGNVFVLPDGAPGFADWQMARSGYWAMDVAYHVASVLEVEDRARHERDLLAHYRARVLAEGGDAPGIEEMWNAYRTFLPYGYYFWGITGNVDPAIIRKFIFRLGSAIAFHNSFDLLQV